MSKSGIKIGAMPFFFFSSSRQQNPGKLKPAGDALVCSPHRPGKPRASLGGWRAHRPSGGELGCKREAGGAESPWASFCCSARCPGGQLHFVTVNPLLVIMAAKFGFSYFCCIPLDGCLEGGMLTMPFAGPCRLHVCRLLFKAFC